MVTAGLPRGGAGAGKVHRTELSPVSFLRRSAFVYPGKVAVVHGERRYTYRDFERRVNRLASALADAGIGVMYTHRGAYLNALADALESGLRPGSVQLWVVPMFHCNGWCFPWAVTAMGARHVCLRKVDPASMWKLFGTEGITHYNGAPTVHTALVNHPAAHRLDHELTVTTGGAPPSPTLLAKMAALNLRPVHVYGLTETYAPYTVCEAQEDWAGLPDQERARRLGRQGVHNMVSDPIRVVDDLMSDVPRDGETIGEVVMRGNNVMNGYFQRRALPARPRIRRTSRASTSFVLALARCGR